MKPSSVMINLRLISARHFLNTNKNTNNLIPQETQLWGFVYVSVRTKYRDLRSCCNQYRRNMMLSHLLWSDLKRLWHQLPSHLFTLFIIWYHSRMRFLKHSNFILFGTYFLLFFGSVLYSRNGTFLQLSKFA